MRRINSANTHRPLHIHQDTSIIFITGRCYAGISWLYPENTKEYFYNKLLEILPKYRLELDAWAICNNHYHLLLRVAQGVFVSKFVKHLHGSTAYYIKQHTPQLVNGDQVLTKEVTAWDKRQTARLNKEVEALERGLKSASTERDKEAIVSRFLARHKNVLANFNSRITDPRLLVFLTSKETPIWYQYMDHVIRDENDYYKHLNYIHQNPVKHGYVDKISNYKWSSIHKWIKDHGKEYVFDCFRNYPVIDFEPVAE